MDKENKENLEVMEENVAPAQETENQETEEQNPQDREAFVEDWNARNKGFGIMRLEPPTPEEVKAIAEEFGAAVEALNNKTYQIADAPNAVRVATFLKKWNEEDAHWSKDLWQGTIMFDAIVKKFLEECREEEKEFEVNYQTLVYLFLCMQDVHGTGLRSALHQNKINEEFVHILDTVGDLIEEYKAENKRVETIQNRWAAMEAGYYITLTEKEENESTLEEQLAAEAESLAGTEED